MSIRLGERRPALAVVNEGGILIDLYTTHRIRDLFGALDGLLAGDDHFEDSRLLLDIDRLAA